jgi:hypothetical protein
MSSAKKENQKLSLTSKAPSRFNILNKGGCKLEGRKDTYF